MSDEAASFNRSAHAIVARARLLAAGKVERDDAVAVILGVASHNREALVRALSHCREVHERDPDDFEGGMACALVSDALDAAS